MSYLGNNLETTNALGKRQPYNVLVGQDTFTVNGGYTPGLVSVFLNGALLVPGVDVDVSDGETVILSTPAITNGVMEVIDFGALALANVVQKSGDTMNGDYNMTGTLVMSSPFTLRNKIINGNFDHWQRGTTTTGVTFVADRWYGGHSGTTKTASRQSFTLGQTDVPNNPKYWMRHVVSSVAGAGNNCTAHQRIEDVTALSGKTVTLSFWAKADVNRNIATEFLQYFGTGGSPSANVSGIGVTTFALTSSWQKFTTTITIPSVSGKTLGTNGDDFTQLAFWFDAGSTYNSRTNSLGQQSGTFDIAQVQIEEGSIATPFEIRPQQIELALCQRYFQYYTSVLNSGYNNTGGTIYLDFSLNASMRNAPTVTILGPSYSNASAALLNATIFGHLRFQAVITSAGLGYAIFNFQADAEL